MKTIRIFLVWPLIVLSVWYFFGLIPAVICALIYLHVITAFLIIASEAQTNKLIQIVQKLSSNNFANDGNLNEISSADDLLKFSAKNNATWKTPK